MNLWLTILGTFFMLMLAYVFFMVVAFTGGGFANSPSTSRRAIKFFDMCLFILPGLPVIASVAAWVAYFVNAGAIGYGIFAIPFIGIALYFFMVGKLTGKRT